MPTKLRRNLPVDMICKECGVEYQAPKSRVKKGQGVFCTRECYAKWYRKNVAPSFHGYEKGKKYWDGKKWTVHWYDGFGKVHVTSYPRWWWTLNKGEIPDGFAISIVDGNAYNIDPSNFECIPITEALGKSGKKLSGVTKPHLAGEKNKWWKGGRTYEYPLQFSKSLKLKIKTRDKFTCQSCLCFFDGGGGLDVHHKDKNKYNNSDDNLVSLCKSCHRAVHGKEDKKNHVILELRKLLVE